jgi:hypothetical protein
MDWSLSEAMRDDLEWFQNEEEKHLRHQIQELEGVRSELQVQHAAYLQQIRSMRACLRSAPPVILDVGVRSGADG